MRNWTIVLAIILAVLGFGYLLSHNKPASSTADGGHLTQASQDAAVAAAMARQNSNTVAVIQSSFANVQTPPPAPVNKVVPPGQPTAPEFTNFDSQIVLENMARAIRKYGTMFGGNPVGNNQEITSQLSGNNPKHINFLDAEQGMRVNANGELIDPWGTPYFFHQLSGTDMEIHSAGPDRIMWTADDLVTH